MTEGKKDIVDGKIGENAAYDVELRGGKLVGEVGVSFKANIAGQAVEVANAKLAIEVDLASALIPLEEKLLDELKAKIPGNWDDVAIDAAKAAIRKVLLA